jgi:hypothetical protein
MINVLGIIFFDFKRFTFCPNFNFIIKFIKVNILKKLYLLFNIVFKKKITSFGSYSM